MKKEMDKIADYLLLRSSYMQELGLFHGKMGVVVALYLYADAYGDEVMREYAWELFQQVYDGVHNAVWPVSVMARHCFVNAVWWNVA